MRYDATRRRVTKLCNTHQLASIMVQIFPGSGQSGYVAIAMPEPYHPKVEKRWRAAMAALTNPLPEDFHRLSQHAMQEVHRGVGSSIEGALKALEASIELEKLV